MKKQNRKPQDCNDYDNFLRRDWNDFWDTCQLSKEQKQELWTAIQNRRGKKQSGRLTAGILKSAAAACILIIGTVSIFPLMKGQITESNWQADSDEITGANRQTDKDEITDANRQTGKDDAGITDHTWQLCEMQPESVEILLNKTPEADVYAPPLLDCDQNRVIFANSRGMVIYDRQQQAVHATIDLQDIGCNYFTADSIQTQMLIQQDQIFIFNTKNGQAAGSCYVYHLPKYDGSVQSLEPLKVIRADDRLQEQWRQRMETRYSDTFSHIILTTGKDSDTEVRPWTEVSDKQETQYSQSCVSWTQDQETYLSCLLLRGRAYSLFTKNQDTGETTEEPLPIRVCEEAASQLKKENELPAFTYTGESKLLQAICTYLISEEQGRYYMQPDLSYVCIPSPVIYGIIEEEGITKVFGNFHINNFYRNGNILENQSGGEMPACFDLKQSQGQYKVIRVEQTGDGAYYEQGIRDFCEGHMDIYQKFFDDPQANQTQRDQVTQAMVLQYVKDHQLDIQYYHDFGWDPVDLSPDAPDQQP